MVIFVPNYSNGVCVLVCSSFVMVISSVTDFDVLGFKLQKTFLKGIKFTKLML